MTDSSPASSSCVYWHRESKTVWKDVLTK